MQAPYDVDVEPVCRTTRWGVPPLPPRWALRPQHPAWRPLRVAGARLRLAATLSRRGVAPRGNPWGQFCCDHLLDHHQAAKTDLRAHLRDKKRCEVLAECVESAGEAPLLAWRDTPLLPRLPHAHAAHNG